MPGGFVLKSGEVAQLEAELSALDHILRDVAGAAARFERQWKGLPGRLVEARRPDGVTFGLIVAPIIRGPLGPEPARYIVTPFAFVKMGGLGGMDKAETVALAAGSGGAAAQGEGRAAEWRQVPVWTIELAWPESLHKARAAIAEAWGRGSTVRREELLGPGEEGAAR